MTKNSNEENFTISPYDGVRINKPADKPSAPETNQETEKTVATEQEATSEEEGSNNNN